MKLRDAATWLPNHLDRVERLGRSLGPTLVRLPPRWKRNVERLDEFLAVAPKHLRWAVELRDPTWLHDDVYDVRPAREPPVGAHDRLDLRPLPRPERARREVPRPLRAEPPRACAERLRPLLDKGFDVYAYFNNDWYGHAVTDAVTLREMLT